MSFIENVKSKVKNDIKTIILPESNDIRVLKATQQILKEEFADIILIGNREQINKLAKENNLDISKAKIVDPKTVTVLTYQKQLLLIRELAKKHPNM